MRFRLYRPRHLRIEGIGESIIRRLREVLSDPRNRRIVAGGAAVALLGALYMPANASALENNMIDTSTDTTHTQTVDYDAMVSDDELTATVNEAVAESQAITDSRHSVPVQEVSASAPVSTVSEAAQEQTTSVQDVTPAVNEEIDSRVPQVDTSTSGEQGTTETSTGTETSTEDSSNESATGNEEITEEKEDVVDDSIQQSEQGVVSDNPVILEQPENDSNQNVSENTDAETVDDETKTDEIQNSQENTNSGYQVISQDGNLIIVGNVPEDQLSQVIEDLTNQYGEEAVNGLTVFDYDTISSQVDYGETVQLGNSGYTATKNENGTIEIKDADGNVIIALQGQAMDISDEQENEQTQTDEGPTFSEDLTIPEDYEHRDFDVNSNEYLIIENADGSYTLAFGGVGLSNNQIQDLISRLQSQGIIPADAKVTLGVLPAAPTDEMKDQGKDVQISKIGDYIITTTDGVNYTVYSADGTVLDTIIKYDDQQLEDNYETSKDPDAEPGNKADVDEPGNEIPGDKPTPEPEPEPEPEPTPEPTPSVVKGEMPQTDDPAALVGALAMTGVSAIGAGAASNKKRKKGKFGKEMDDDSFEPTYDDLEMTAQEWVNSNAGQAMQPQQQTNQYDYDELEAIAEQWKNSKEREEWLQQQKPKGRTR